MKATVITDASFCQQTKAGGWAAWIAFDGGAKEQHSGVFRSRPQNSGFAELQAALNGIWFAYRRGSREILVQTDCLAVVHAAKHTGAYAEAFRKARVEHFPDAVINAKHVKGHTKTADARSWCNRWCDREAKYKMRQQRDAVCPH